MICYVARNLKGDLRFFRWEPQYCEKFDMWYEEHLEDGYGDMWDSDFPEVTFENSPQEVELKLI